MGNLNSYLDFGDQRHDSQHRGNTSQPWDLNL